MRSVVARTPLILWRCLTEALPLAEPPEQPDSKGHSCANIVTHPSDFVHAEEMGTNPAMSGSPLGRAQITCAGGLAMAARSAIIA